MNILTCDACKYYDKFYAIRDEKWMKGLEYQGIGRCMNKKSDRHLCVQLQHKSCGEFEKADKPTNLSLID